MTDDTQIEWRDEDGIYAVRIWEPYATFEEAERALPWLEAATAGGPTCEDYCNPFDGAFRSFCSRVQIWRTRLARLQFWLGQGG